MIHGHDYPHNTEVQFLDHLDTLSVNERNLRGPYSPNYEAT